MQLEAACVPGSLVVALRFTHMLAKMHHCWVQSLQMIYSFKSSIYVNHYEYMNH